MEQAGDGFAPTVAYVVRTTPKRAGSTARRAIQIPAWLPRCSPFLTSDKRTLSLVRRHTAGRPPRGGRFGQDRDVTEIQNRRPGPEAHVVTFDLAEVSAVEALLPALLVDEPDEQVVTDTLLARVDMSAQLERLIEGLAELLERARAPATRRAWRRPASP